MDDLSTPSAPLPMGEWEERYFAFRRLQGEAAHDINNYQQAVESGLFYLERLPPGEEREKVKRMISTNMQDTKAATQKLLRGSEEAPVSCLEPVELRPILERIMLEKKGDFEAQKVRYICEVHGALPQVRGNASDIHQALTNIVSNALEVMPQGGRFSMTAAFCARDGLPERVEVRVEDTGPGIPREHQERVFLREYTTKPSGHGLGLAVARTKVLSAGGSIWVESEPGFGAAFIVALPVVRNENTSTSENIR
jgi:two-component system sensor histidine kinase HydH